MTAIEELKKERQKKRDVLVDFGMDPYPRSVPRTHKIEDTFALFDDSDGSSSVSVVGRVMGIREHGSVIFADLRDGSGEIQIVLKEDEISDELFSLFLDAIDSGDFVSVTGQLFETKTGQESVLVEDWVIAAKSLRPIPQQYSGLKDKETRLRKRYLDILMNENVAGIVKKRADFWKAIRTFLEQESFLEVQTPILEQTPGGADARAFSSHHNALDMEVFLRISAGELWQKKLLVSGFEKVFEIGRVFRNEGISPEHAQDYTQMEFYWAYADAEDGMELVKRMYRHIVSEVFKKTTFKIRGHEVDFSDEWEQYDYQETILEHTGIDISNTSVNEIADKLQKKGVTLPDDTNLTRAIDRLWKLCRKDIAGPGFLVNIPKQLSPLAKETTKDSNTVAQFQPIIAGSELGKGYSELNDPEEQAGRFQKQQALREAGDEEAQRQDNQFVEALEYGMPPACGFGISERLFSFLVDVPIREAQIFPLLKDKQSKA